jgi:hypothetical protein
MQRLAQRIQFDDHASGSVRFLTGLPHVRLEEGDGKRSQTVTILRTGQWNHPAYGRMTIDKKMLQSMVRNFDNNTYGQRIFIDVAHRPDNGAAAEIRRLFVEGNRLRADVEFTDYGVDAVKNKGFVYLSADFHENWENPETGKEHGPVLFGAGLVTRPFVKRMDPVDPDQLELGDDAGEGVDAVVLHPSLSKQLSEEAHRTAMNHRERLKKQLQDLGLAENVINTILASYDESAKALGEDENALKALADNLGEAGKQLSEQIGSDDKPVQINLGEISTGGQGLSKEDVQKLLQEERDAENRRLQEQKQALETNQKAFTDALDAAEGLSDETRKELKDQGLELITGDMSAEQVKKFADHQISQGQKIESARKLSDLGFTHGPGGRVAVTPGQDSTGQQLQDLVDQQFKRTNSYAMGRLALTEQDKVNPFCRQVLAMYDQINGPKLYAEHRMLANGETDIGGTDLPVSVQRSVIREALSDLRVLELVQTLTDMQAQGTTEIPYEVRDTDSVHNDGIVYEGNAIHRAGVEQKMDLAYVVPMKIAMIVSNEVAHFSRNSRIDWDAWARNVSSNSRLMRELVVRRICNELQRATDAYGATAVTGEDLSSQTDGSTSQLKLANFPLVRPHQPKDLQGNNVGTAEHTITITMDGSPVEAYDGTGNQSAGTYYKVTNYNLGYIQLVDETGSPATPDPTNLTIDYSYATNVEKFDLDVPSGTLESRHLNGLLRAIGARKAVLSADRFVSAEYMLMSPVLNDIATNAEGFAASGRRSGSELDGGGDLETIKAVDAYATNAPSVDLGDERIILGSRGQLTYTVAKPMTMGDPFEATDGNGNPTGQKQAYGEEYNAVHVPKPIRGRMTSVIAYSATSRSSFPS